MTPLSLIICASPRSGSFFLSDLLNRCGLPFGDEWLTPFHEGSRKWQYGADPELPYLDYLRLLSEKERREGKFTLKVMYPQFRELRSALEALEMPPGASFKDRIQAVFPNPRFIFLTRKDTLAQAISHWKARQTGQWVRRSGQSEQAGIEPVYSFIGIAQLIEERENIERNWRELFSQEALEVFPVVFEQLKREPRAEMESLFNWLGMEMPDSDLDNRDSRFSRMATALNDSWKDRFNEDLAQCRGPGDEDPGPDLAALSIREVDLKESYPLTEGCRFSVRVAASDGQLTAFRGSTDGQGWLRVVGSLKGPGTEDWFQQELRLSGSDLVAECLLPPPGVAGDFRLKLALADGILGHETIEDRCAWSQSVRFFHTGPRAECRALLPDLQDLPNGWQCLPWFGHFLDDKFPWIYHADHEWLYLKPQVEKDGAYHVLDANLGWLEIHPQRYPRIRSLESNKEWTFICRDQEKRTFRDEQSGETFAAETNRPEHLKKLGN